MQATWHRARKLLCVRLGSAGDVLLTTPALHALKEAMPGRHLTLRTSPSGAHAARLSPPTAKTRCRPSSAHMLTLGSNAAYHDSGGCLVRDGEVVAAAEEERFTRIKQAFERRAGVPVLVNTSFNSRGEPVVCTARDALASFWSTPLAALAIGASIIGKPT